MGGARTPLVLLPPSEGKAPGGQGAPWAPGTLVLPGLDPLRAQVVRALGGGVATAATRPAIDRYTGVLYQHLDYPSLPTALRRRADRQVLVFSGLWGVVGLRDPIPDYRCKMGRALPGLGTLATWWRTPLSEALAPTVAGRTVWNLLPNEHAAAWRPELVAAPGTSGGPAVVVTVAFLEEVERGGRRQLVTVSHWNKALKGAVVRAVLSGQLRRPEDLRGFTHPAGYRYDEARTEVAVGGDPARAHVVLTRR